jgi:hypothetical protein
MTLLQQGFQCGRRLERVAIEAGGTIIRRFEGIVHVAIGKVCAGFHKRGLLLPSGNGTSKCEGHGGTSAASTYKGGNPWSRPMYAQTS